MGYLVRTAKGISWMGALRVSTRGISYIRIVILARLLSPEQFGIFGIATLVLAFLETITETGINVFLIQNTRNIKDYVSTAWVISIFRGALISIIIILVAPVITSFFDTPSSYKLLLVISLIPFLRGFINPAIAKFQKELKFKKEFLLRFSIFSFDAIISIALVLVTRSVISLVWGLIAGVILELLISHALIKPKPRFTLEKNKLKEIISRGKWVTASGMFNYLFHQGDDVVVGRVLGSSPLGLYQLAYKVSTLPIFEVGEVFNKVTFPVYTKISSDKKRLKKAFFKVTIIISLFVIPFGLILFLFPEQVIRIVLGERWLAAVPAFRVLSIFGIVRAISGSSSALFMGLKKQKYITVVTLTSIVGLGISIVPLVSKYGIMGAAMSALIGSVFALPVVVYYLLKVFK